LPVAEDARLPDDGKEVGRRHRSQPLIV
jgi:hypothetical protein